MENLGPSNDIIPPSEFRLAETIAREAVRIKLTNERFKALSPARKRVIIVKDVLKWLAVGKLKVHTTTGTGYIDGFPMYYAPGEKVTVNGDSCTACAIGGLFAVAVERGECGGSVFIPREPGNDGSPRRPVLAGTNDGNVDIHTAMAGFFDKRQLCLIEAAYEGRDNVPASTKVEYIDPGHELDTMDACRIANADATFEKAISFGEAACRDVSPVRFPTGEVDNHATRKAQRTARITAIMDNIIANKGTFVP